LLIKIDTILIQDSYKIDVCTIKEYKERARKYKRTYTGLDPLILHPI